MKNLQNLHTHSTFDHGVNTPLETITAAIAKGFDSIGFSGHAYTSYSTNNLCITPDKTEEYKKEILRCKKEYAGIIGVYLGLEFDMYSDTPTNGYDYIIGACHYLKMGTDYLCIDTNESHYRKIIDEYFGGDGLRLAKEYFRQASMLPKFAKTDILAHFDLIAKNVDRASFFDYQGKEYISAATEALEALKKDVPLFEINTGGVVRGYRKTPYPMLTLIKEMKRLGYGAVISSDCHDARFLDAYFEDAALLLKEAGFKEKYILSDSAFKAVRL